MNTIDSIAFEEKCIFKTSRSSGPGGQHVNKTESRITLYFDVVTSTLFTNDEKISIINHLSSYITTEGYLQLSCDAQRSQLQNKRSVIERALMMLNKALVPKKPRKPTRPTRSSIEKRLDGKRKTALKKTNRGNHQFDL